jgi:hypothetical protein
MHDLYDAETTAWVDDLTSDDDNAGPFRANHPFVDLDANYQLGIDLDGLEAQFFEEASKRADLWQTEPFTHWFEALNARSVILQCAGLPDDYHSTTADGACGLHILRQLRSPHCRQPKGIPRSAWGSRGSQYHDLLN